MFLGRHVICCTVLYLKPAEKYNLMLICIIIFLYCVHTNLDKNVNQISMHKLLYLI